MINFDLLKDVMENAPRLGPFYILSKKGDDTVPWAHEFAKQFHYQKDKQVYLEQAAQDLEEGHFLTACNLIVYNKETEAFSEKGVYKNNKGVYFKGNPTGGYGKKSIYYLP